MEFPSNGPGDPEPCDYAIDTVRRLIDMKIPIFSEFCSGTSNWKRCSRCKNNENEIGHHGANHPVLDIDSGKVIITSQNQRFCR